MGFPKTFTVHTSSIFRATRRSSTSESKDIESDSRWTAEFVCRRFVCDPRPNVAGQAAIGRFLIGELVVGHSKLCTQRGPLIRRTVTNCLPASDATEGVASQFIKTRQPIRLVVVAIAVDCREN